MVKKNYWVRLLVLSLIVSLSLTAYDTVVAQDTDLPQTFTATSGLSIRYPDGWIARESNFGIEIANSAEILDVIDNGDDTTPGQVAMIAMGPIPAEDLSGMSVVDVVTLFSGGMANENESAKESGVEELIVNGIPAARAYASNPGTNSDGFILGLDFDGTQILVMGIAYQGELVDIEPTLLAMVESITLEVIEVVADDTAPSSQYNGKFAFTSDRGGNYEIYVMNADGSNLQNLTNNNAKDLLPAWSPDESQIAFMSNRDGCYGIYVMNADGSNLQRLTNRSACDAIPTWSPDGSRIAFVSDRDGNYELYVMNADGSNPQRLTNNNAEDWSPAWSPDGNWIAFDSNRDGDNEIYVIDTDGNNLQRLTDHNAEDLFPAWSPDGSRIAFVSDRDGNNELYVMNADGSNPQRLTNHSAGDFDPTWSPDGSWIAFYSNRDGNNELYVMNADGSNPQRLTNNNASDWSPAWAPGGSR